MSNTQGRLTVVGTGIGFRGHVIPAAETAIRRADTVMFQLDDVMTTAWVRELNPHAEDLEKLAPRRRTLSPHVYEAMANHVAAAVVEGHEVCFVTYGHPGVYQHAAHRSGELVREAGLPATMLPGISALDCLIADLGIEIGPGCHLLDATTLVLQSKPLDPTSSLVLFQIGIFGNPYYGGDRPVPLRLLTERLRDAWGDHHEAVLYEAAVLPESAPTVHTVRLRDLDSAPLSERMLLYLERSRRRPVDVVASAEIAAALASRR